LPANALQKLIFSTENPAALHLFIDSEKGVYSPFNLFPKKFVIIDILI